MKYHLLKSDPEDFSASWDKLKPYELRFDDKNFNVGDEVALVETVNSAEEMARGALLSYTGRAILGTIIHKAKNRPGIRDGWCVLIIKQFRKMEDFFFKK